MTAEPSGGKRARRVRFDGLRAADSSGSAALPRITAICIPKGGAEARPF
ncbi:MAG TPA: hypothetical protein VJ747_13955 [Stellaceae bacterium]|nr:hypothetical protein [Stellaceae bacterium]